MMQPSRRQALRLGVVAAAAAAAPVALVEQAFAVLTPAYLVRRTFRPLVGSRFLVTRGRRRYVAVLVSVGDLRHSRPGDPNQFRLQFSVRGAGPGEGTFRFEHARLAPFRLFVTPVGGRAGDYEAIVVSAR